MRAQGNLIEDRSDEINEGVIAAIENVRDLVRADAEAMRVVDVRKGCIGLRINIVDSIVMVDWLPKKDRRIDRYVCFTKVVKVESRSVELESVLLVNPMSKKK